MTVEEKELAPGAHVRVRASGAVGVVVEVFRRWRTVDVDLGDGVVAELGWDEVEWLPERPPN